MSIKKNFSSGEGKKRANLDGKGAGETLIHVGTVKLEADYGGVRISFENFVPPQDLPFSLRTEKKQLKAIKLFNHNEK